MFDVRNVSTMVTGRTNVQIRENICKGTLIFITFWQYFQRLANERVKKRTQKEAGRKNCTKNP